jgi:hypothetical protein
VLENLEKEGKATVFRGSSSDDDITSTGVKFY